MSTGSCDHTIHGAQHHNAWDNALAPALEVESGASVEFEVVDASGGQVRRDSTADDLVALDFTRVNPVTGPVSVRGARPGDVLEVEVLEFEMSDWGWTAIIPGFGLLADAFPEPWLKIWDLTPGGPTARFEDGIDIPVAPFPGTIGVAPPEPGPHSIVPPRAWGGNLDIKHLTVGTRLYLPVGVEGALFSVGDTHAAQGDGEVCGTAIESPMRVALRFRIRRDLTLARPAFETTRAAPTTGEPGAFVTTGVADDLMVASRQAVEGMIEHLGRVGGLDAASAYALASVAVDLRIHEVVDVPNWVVGAWLPNGIVRR
ncbi:acetamidase/formamidase family protein [soil metagenome]|nr:acetamidase/formamidase family protein [Trueperaceae bacterium]